MNPFDHLATLAAVRRRQRPSRWTVAGIVLILSLAALWRARKGNR